MVGTLLWVILVLTVAGVLCAFVSFGIDDFYLPESNGRETRRSRWSDRLGTAAILLLVAALIVLVIVISL